MKKNTWFFDCLWLALFLCLFFGWMLGSRALSIPDEGRYSEIPREMLWLHDFITPHLDGFKYFEKPPLLYWMQSGVMSWFGINEWALRAPTAIMAGIGCLSTYATGRFLFDRKTGVVAALILATSPLYFLMAHSITTDMTVSVWITVTLFSFIVAMNLSPDSLAQRNICWLMFASAALSVLTKGLIGIILPSMVVVTWLVMFNRFRDLKTLHWFSGLSIFLFISVPWHVLVQIKNPEFFRFYFIDQHFLRYFTKAMGRYQPVWWFAPILLLGLFPWAAFLFQALRKAINISWCNRDKQKNQIFFLIGAIEIFFFFSFSDSKLIPYILPIFPLLTLLVADYLVKWWVDAGFKKREQAISLQLFGWLPIIFSAFLIAAKWLPLSLDVSLVQYIFLRVLAIPLALIGVGILLLKCPEMKLKFALFMQIIFLGCLCIVIPHFDTRPIKPLALLIKQLAKEEDLIVDYNNYHQDLPVYTERFVLIVNWVGELEFGSKHQPLPKNRLLDSAQFWQLWQKPQRVFAVMKASDYEAKKSHHRMYVLGQSHDNNDDLLVSNQ